METLAREIIDALAWVAVVVLAVAHWAAARDRLHRHAGLFRTISAVAALLVTLSAALAGVWPAAGLGLLWMRNELLGHEGHERAIDDDWVPDLIDDGPPPSPLQRWGRSARRWIGRVWQPVMMMLLRLEILVIVLALLAGLAWWMGHTKVGFDRNADTTLCRVAGRC